LGAERDKKVVQLDKSKLFIEKKGKWKLNLKIVEGRLKISDGKLPGEGRG